MHPTICIGLRTIRFRATNLLSLGRNVLTCRLALMTMTVIGRLLDRSSRCAARICEDVLNFLTLCTISVLVRFVVRVWRIILAHIGWRRYRLSLFMKTASCTVGFRSPTRVFARLAFALVGPLIRWLLALW